MTNDAGEAAYRPMQAQDALPIWASGDELVFYKGTRFPQCCVKCGAAASTEVRKTLTWHPQWLYVLIVFPGWLVYLIAALATQKKAEVALPLCADHDRRRRRWIAAACVSAIAGLAVAFGVPMVASSATSDASDMICAGAGVGGLVLLASLVMALVGSRVVYPTFIDDQTVRVRGVGKAFLAMAPRM